MWDVIFAWDLLDDPDGNVQHLAEHGVDQSEAEYVILRGVRATSRSSGHIVSFAIRRRVDIWRSFGSGSTTIR